MASPEIKLLVVEDDARIRRELLDALRAASFRVDVAVSCEDAENALAHDYDLMLLDLGLPDGDGLDLCRSLRQRGRSMPIIVVTARDEPDQRVRGLDVGADDYVVKPSTCPNSWRGYAACCVALGRTPGLGPVRLGSLWADPDSRTAGMDDRRLDLTPREFDLLVFLLRHPGRAWTRDQLLDRVWGPSYRGEARTVDSHVRRLRAQIGEDTADPRSIETVWGVGYRLREER